MSEEMTNKQAMEILEAARKTMYLPKSGKYISDMGYALEKGIAALEAEPCEDCISRADAEALFRNARGELHNSAIRNEQNGHPIKDLPTRDLMLLNAEQMIHLLPSVNPQKPSISEDGTLIVNVEDDSKVSRVLVCGDDHFGGLYYPEQEPRTGYWITLENHFWKCSECRCCEISKSNWCPNCGAKMVEPQESEDKCVICANNGMMDDECAYCTNHNLFRAESEDKE